MTTAAELFGGHVEITTAAGRTLAWWTDRRVQSISTSVPGLTMTLPDLDDTGLPVGHLVLMVHNRGSNAFTVVDQNSLGISESVAADAVAFCSIYLDGSTRKWHVDVRTGA